ncbi:MAG: glycerol-3-phosphate 1-O-acyltransferase PlsY [Chloroflexi bacterium]|nr:glycerol-3-phosphate 1-O-acyltransferase PlsY [Chloroflexota bacterium]
MVVLEYTAVILLGYCLGAIPFGLVAGRLTRGVDVREYGSGKTGFANVLRSAGWRAGLLTLLADVSKGAAPVSISWVVLHSHGAQVAAALAAMVGHIWPVYTRFRGGRGVSTFAGGMLAMYWPVGLACGPGVGLGTAALTRYMSLGSILVAVSSLLVMLVMVLLETQPKAYLIYAAIGGGLILFQHRDNIQRLRTGTERRLGERADRRESSSHQAR